MAGWRKSIWNLQRLPYMHNGAAGTFRISVVNKESWGFIQNACQGVAGAILELSVGADWGLDEKFRSYLPL